MVKFFIEFLQELNVIFLGVDDGQFGKVIAHEIPLIRQAFNRKCIHTTIN